MEYHQLDEIADFERLAKVIQRPGFHQAAGIRYITTGRRQDHGYCGEAVRYIEKSFGLSEKLSDGYLFVTLNSIQSRWAGY